MEKLKIYNQKVLAILATMVLVVITVLILLGGYSFLSKFFKGPSEYDGFDNSITVENTNDSTFNKEPKIRDQQVSFGLPILIDSADMKYIVPVMQVMLKEPEKIGSEAEYLLEEPVKSSRSSQSFRHYGAYNNLIIYDQTTGSNTALFNSRISISSFQPYKINSNHFLLIEGANSDSNRNGKLNEFDLKSFYVYDVSSSSMKGVSFEQMGLFDYYLTNNSSEIILRFGYDKDNSGDIDDFQEPLLLKKLSLSTYEINDVINEALVNKLQGLID